MSKPGDSIDVSILFSGENGLEVTRSAHVQIPIGAPTGTLNLTVSDANGLNFPELAGLSPVTAGSPDQLIHELSAIRPSDRAYLRVWRQEPSFPLSGTELTDPPPSVSMILARGAGTGATMLFAASRVGRGGDARRSRQLCCQWIQNYSGGSKRVNSRILRSLIKAVALITSLGASLFAATSTTWETGTYAEFLKGKLQGLALTSDGVLQPGASIRKSTAVEQPVLWTVVPGPDGSLYAATGHRGKVFKVDREGRHFGGLLRGAAGGLCPVLRFEGHPLRGHIAERRRLSH